MDASIILVKRDVFGLDRIPDAGSGTQIPDDVYELVRKYCDEKELVNITMAIVTINSWNRLSIAFRSVPGTYQPPKS